ncbi:MAG: hypothetical protein K0Q55_525 [Verrucomicrobia bacterium]|nr:hypothetical protein [Verrucomicrobiota bacterium]
MKAAPQKKLKGEDWLAECFEYERTHEIAFASPRALLEARMIAEMDKARRSKRRTRPSAAASRRKTVAA